MPGITTYLSAKTAAVVTSARGLVPTPSGSADPGVPDWAPDGWSTSTFVAASVAVVVAALSWLFILYPRNRR